MNRGDSISALIQREQPVDGVYALTGVQKRLDKKSNPYWDLVLKDRSGSVAAKIWMTRGRLVPESLDNDIFAHVVGRVEFFNGMPQVKISGVTPLTPGEIAGMDISEFLPPSPYDGRGAYGELMSLADREFTYAPWKNLVKGFFGEEGNATLFMNASAATAMHHAGAGGLAVHTLGVFRACQAEADLYPDIDRQILLAGALFHDIGKMREMRSTAFETTYTPEGNLMGHLTLGVLMLEPYCRKAGLPDPQSLLAHFRLVTKLLRTGAAVAAYTPGMGGPAEAVMKMAFGNGFGFDFDEKVTMEDLFGYAYGSFVLELDGHEPVGKMLGTIRPDSRFVWHGESVNGVALQKAYEEKLEPVYSCNIPDAQVPVETVSFQAQTRVCPAAKTGRPKVLIPVFPGTNCEYDSAKAMMDAGAEAEIFVIRNLTAAAIAQSVEEFAGKLKKAQMVFLPGGFSGGDEPDGSAKFITAFFRNAAIKEAITALLEERDGLMLGICNGFQALIKLGLLPYGKILDTDADCPTLTYNTIGRHQSRLVRTRIASNLSPWLSGTQVGEVYTVPISHGEGRFLAEEALVKQLAARGQIATQYVDLAGNATTDVHFNPNGSIYAIEGITSPDGRILGKMGHSERKGFGLYKNVPGEFDMKLFESAVKYFK